MKAFLAILAMSSHLAEVHDTCWSFLGNKGAQAVERCMLGVLCRERIDSETRLDPTINRRFEIERCVNEKGI